MRVFKMSLSNFKEGFYDLNISDKFEYSDLSLLAQFNYKTMAINTLIDESSFNVKKKGKNNDTQSETVDVVPSSSKTLENDSSVTLLNRLTIQFGDVPLLSKLNQSENLKKYDILAAIPTTQNALNHACTTMDVDIISFSLDFMNNYKINRKLYKQAVERGIYFEIPYAYAFGNPVHRKNIIQRSHLYHSIGRSANVLITSGAENYFQIRSPSDIINLGRIFGLNEARSVRAITESARKVLLKADSRRRGKAAVFFYTNEEADAIVLTEI